MYRLISQRTGMDRPAEYETILRKRLATNSEVLTVNRAQGFNRLAFRVPEEMTIREYLENQFSQQSITECEEGNAFRIVN